MKFKALILVALVLVLSVFAETKDDEPLHTNTYSGYGGGGGSSGGGGGGGAGSYSAGFSHGGVYGGGEICKWGCCSESFGYSHEGGGYYSCTCCATADEAKAYRESQPKLVSTKN